MTQTEFVAERDLAADRRALGAGMAHARRGEWHAALVHLSPIFEQQPDGLELPGLFWSAYGHALARCERRHDQARLLCERGVEEQFYEPETWLHLAWVHVLRGDRAAGFDALARGLVLHPGHPRLRDLHRRLGERRCPVLRFLPREHPVNVKLGKLRHVLGQDVC